MTEILKAYKTELDPNDKQVALFRQCAGTARFVFNWGLATWQHWYEDGKKPSEYSLRKHFTEIKDEQCSWIREYPYAVTEAAFANLSDAFKHFFRRVKQGETSGYPKFKKRGQHDSFQLRDVKVKQDRIYLPSARGAPKDKKFGWVRLKERGYIPTSGKYGIYATISRQADRWFISVLVYEDAPEVELTDDVIGVDLGIKSIAVCSDGAVFDNPRTLAQAERKLKRLQRELSRRTKGGANWRKTQLKLQRQYAKVANIRRHIQHQISHHVTVKAKPRAVVLEDLNVSGMVKNHHLAKAVSDVGFYELRRQIEYKAEKLGIEVVLASMWYPSSKTCSGCGWKNEGLTLGDRVFSCPQCGLELDRDYNAAINLSRLAV